MTNSERQKSIDKKRKAGMLNQHICSKCNHANIKMDWKNLSNKVVGCTCEDFSKNPCATAYNRAVRGK